MFRYSPYWAMAFIRFFLKDIEIPPKIEMDKLWLRSVADAVQHLAVVLVQHLAVVLHGLCQVLEQSVLHHINTSKK